MVLSREAEIYRNDARSSGQLLDSAKREALLAPYLPSPKSGSPSSLNIKHHQPVRSFLLSQFHFLIYAAIHALFSIYIRLRRAYHATSRRISAILYYHHHTPELIRRDVKNLSRLPKHLSVILSRYREDQTKADLEVLLDEVSEVSAWCASVGIPVLSVYERTGILKNHVPTVHEAVASRLVSYFGKQRPSLQVGAPHMSSILDGDSSEENASTVETSTSGYAPFRSEGPADLTSGHLSVLLLSAEDGRSTIVDLAKTLAEMSQHGKLTPSDVSLDLIDSEITEGVMEEPDLLLLFGPTVHLDGYPPWQLRLTEIFQARDNSSVEYLIWLKGLHKYAKAQMRFGR